MATAVRIGRTLIPHARRVFDHMDVLPEIHLARYVWERIITYNGEEPLTKREIHRRCQGKKEINEVGNLTDPLSILKKHHFIRMDRKATGGRPSDTIEVNPKAPRSADKSDKRSTDVGVRAEVAADGAEVEPKRKEATERS